MVFQKLPSSHSKELAEAKLEIVELREKMKKQESLRTKNMIKVNDGVDGDL